MNSDPKENDILSILLDEEQESSARENVFFIARWTDEQYKLGNFKIVDDLLADIDVSQFGEDELVAFMTFTYCVRDLLSYRKSFVERSFAHLKQVIGDDVEQLRELE